MDIADLQAEAISFLANMRLANVKDARGQRWLEIPGHVKGVIIAHKQGRARREIRLRPHPNKEFFEETTTLLMSFFLSRFRPKVFFDVGSHKGYFSLLAASHMAARPDVHAFDMQPIGIKRLNKAVQDLTLPGTIVGHVAGLSDCHRGNVRIWYAGTKMFEYEPDASEYREAWWLRPKFAIQGNSDERALRSADVLLTTLDRFCADRELVPEFMKIDVDGYEGKVLQGAREILHNAQPIIFLELHKDAKQRHGILRREVVAMIFDAGYAALFMTGHHNREKCKLIPVGPDHPLFARQETDMVLFVPPRLSK